MRSLALVLIGMANLAIADTPLQMVNRYQAESGQVASVERGRQLYHGKFSVGKFESCQDCHTADPRQGGRHARTHKAIEPLAPGVNKERFSDPEKVEKWFRRNCGEVLGRACTAREKADFIAYLIASE